MINIEKYIKLQESKKLLKFITCGSVDDGKSTFIGRLLYDSKMIFEDQIESLKKDSKKYGTLDEKVDFALLVDGLQSEREQGITIDVAYRFFSTNSKKYIIVDTPGHEQYTRNMVTGASTAELAVILIDARKGLLSQTKRHSFIVTLLGIKHLIIAINKMDLVDYSQEIYKKIIEDYKRMFEKLKYSLPYKDSSYTIKFIPISAVNGENIVNTSKKMLWYQDKPVLKYLDELEINYRKNTYFRFPIQYVNRPNHNFRGYCGLLEGEAKKGDKVIIYPSKKSTIIKDFIIQANSSLTLIFEDELDISRGDLVVKKDEIQPYYNDSFEAMIVWMDEKELRNTEYILKIYTKEVNAKIVKILFKKDINNWNKISTESLKLNDIARVKIDIDQKIAFDFYEKNKTTGSFILIDKISNKTIVAGIIVGETTKSIIKRNYSKSEIELNRFIRKNFPEWSCKNIDELL